MRNYVYTLLILFLVTLSGCVSADNTETSASVDGQAAVVLSVTDGDTIKVRLAENGREEKVRLTLVDTPEIKHPRLDVQPFGKEASQYTTAQINREKGHS